MLIKSLLFAFLKVHLIVQLGQQHIIFDNRVRQKTNEIGNSIIIFRDL